MVGKPIQVLQPTSSRRSSATWMRKPRNQKDRGGITPGRHRSEGCSTRRGDDPGMIQFGSAFSGMSTAAARLETGGAGESRPARPYFGKNSAGLTPIHTPLERANLTGRQQILWPIRRDGPLCEPTKWRFFTARTLTMTNLIPNVAT